MAIGIIFPNGSLMFYTIVWIVIKFNLLAVEAVDAEAGGVGWGEIVVLYPVLTVRGGVSSGGACVPTRVHYPITWLPACYIGRIRNSIGTMDAHDKKFDSPLRLRTAVQGVKLSKNSWTLRLPPLNC